MARKRLVLIGFPLLLSSLACPAAAQSGWQGPTTPDPDFRLIPVLVYAPGLTRHEVRHVVTADGELTGAFSSGYGRGAGAGALLEVRAAGVFRIAGSVLMIARADGVQRSDLDDAEAVRPAARQLLASVGLAMRFEERERPLQIHAMTTALHAGPVYILEIPRGDARPMSAWGVRIGVDGGLRLSETVAVHAGFEDSVIVWDNTELARRVDEDFAAIGVASSSQVTSRASHLWLIRLGLAFQFR